MDVKEIHAAADSARALAELIDPESIGRGTRHLFKALEAASDELKKREWLPIESAPRDGTRILAECHGQIDAVSFCPEYKQWLEDDGDWMSCNNWMPLPEPPEVE